MTLRVSTRIDRSALAGQFSKRERSQFLVEQRQELLCSAGIARFDPRDVAHRRPSNNDNVHDCSNCDAVLPRLSRGLKRC